MGDEFHGLLLEGCRTAARRYAPDAVSADGLHTLVTAGRRNILGCIEDCLPIGTTAGVLDCMRVFVPTEAHLLCALHAAFGAPLITINFDDGIEVAHALLTGRATLPSEVPTMYHDALAQWRRLMPARTPLHVISTPAQLAKRDDPSHRPTLVKLRGSVDQGTDSTVIPLRPALEDMESTRLDDDRFAALTAVAGCDHLVVTGHSGRDLDCFESLRMVLRPGRFSWVVPEMDPSVRVRIGAIDATQPQRGTAEQVLRSMLPNLPPWPRTRWRSAYFAGRFKIWWSGLPEEATAEAYAWMLAHAGHFEEAIAIIRGLRLFTDTTRLRLRLADILVQRGGPADLAEAEHIFTAALGEQQPYPWFHIETRRVQAAPDTALDALVGILATVATHLAEGAQCDGGPKGSIVAGTMGDAVLSRSAIQCVTIISQLLRDWVGGVGESLPEEVWSAISQSLRLARERADRLGTGARQSYLELEIVAVATLWALHGGPPPPCGAADRIDAVERAFAHRGDTAGGLRVASVRALGCLAAGDLAGAARAVDRLHGAGARPESHYLSARLSAGVRRIAAGSMVARV